MIWCLMLLQILTFQEVDLNKKDTIVKYDIVLKGKIVGQLQASRTFKDSKNHYQSSTNISTKFIKNINVNYKYDVIFNNDNLKKADVYITVNNKLHAETKTEWLGNLYKITQDDEQAIFFSQTISYSTILMYFIEPKGISACFSEEDGTMNTIESLGNHSYKKINSKGKENIYYYENGKLIKADIDGGLISFQMIAK